MSGFAVFDVETTGLYNSDRIVEVGVVLLDENLRVEYEWATLLNPHRHLSASEIHGITASDVAGAPSFDDVAAHLAALLDRRVVVAHNATFDLRMLSHALDHAQMDSPGSLVVVDTLRLSRAALGGPASLPVIAEYLSIDAPSSHEALADAQVTGQVLARLLEQSDGLISSGAALRTFGPTSVAALEILDECLVDADLPVEHGEPDPIARNEMGKHHVGLDVREIYDAYVQVIGIGIGGCGCCRPVKATLQVVQRDLIAIEQRKLRADFGAHGGDRAAVRHG